MKEKRSVVSPKRLDELSKASTYVISCGIDGCPCGNPSDGCGRGFFSLFIQAMNGYVFAQDHGIQPYVDFGNTTYCYTDSSKEEKNFWNYYFLQSGPAEKLASKSTLNRFIEVYPIRIWHRSYFREINKLAVSQLRFTPEVDKIMTEAASKIKQQKTLGIQLRGTDHKDEIKEVKPSSYIKVVRKYIADYDKLFVATDDKKLLEILKQNFGEKVFTHDVIRSADGKAVHLDTSITNRYKLGLEVLLDSYCLAHCDRLILVSSNVSFAALLFNPEVPYEILERFETRLKRWKTLLVYLLDRLGIRKW